MESKQFTITKRIAKHGKQAVIIVPTLLQEQLCPGKIVEITIKELERGTKTKWKHKKQE